MNQSKISVRYAKALFMLAKEKNILDSITNDMQLIDQACQTEELAGFLDRPIISTTEKSNVIQSLLKNKVNDISLAFIQMILDNKREFYIRDIIRNFIDLFRKEKGIKTVMISSAIELDESIRKKIVELVQESFKSKVELNEKVNKDLLGGYILRIEDQQIDNSVAGKLKVLKRELINTTFDKKIV